LDSEDILFIEELSHLKIFLINFYLRGRARLGDSFATYKHVLL